MSSIISDDLPVNENDLSDLVSLSTIEDIEVMVGSQVQEIMFFENAEKASVHGNKVFGNVEDPDDVSDSGVVGLGNGRQVDQSTFPNEERLEVNVVKPTFLHVEGNPDSTTFTVNEESNVETSTFLNDESAFPNEESLVQNVVCPVCKKKCLTSGGLKRHRCKETTVHAFECDSCDDSFVSLGGLKKHTLSKHTIKGKIHQCTECSARYMSKGGLNHHKANKHSLSTSEIEADKSGLLYDSVTLNGDHCNAK